VFLDDENATGVSKEATLPEPAKNAEIASAGGAPGAAPASSSAAAAETPVSTLQEPYPAHHHDVAQIDTFDPKVRAIVEPLIETAVHNLGVQLSEDTAVGVRKMIEDAKADILAHLTPMLRAFRSDRAIPEIPIPEVPGATFQDRYAHVPRSGHTLEIGDPVKVWQDAEHKTFLEGQVAAVHDGAAAFDVELADGSATKVGADGLEYDDHK